VTGGIGETEKTGLRAGVNGASGYMGGKIASRLAAEGWNVLGLGRRPAGLPGVSDAEYRLGETPKPEALAGLDALVHCAWDFGQRTWRDIDAVNVQGTKRLFEAASEAGVGRIVHISTVSASGVPRSMYGRAKLFTEAAALERGGAVVRPGLLYGGEAGGMVGMLTALVRALPVVPVLVGPDRPLFLAHEDDVTALVAMVAGGSEPSAGAPLVAASREPHTLREILGAIAESEGRRRLFLRVPWQTAYLPLRAAEAVRVPLPMRSDSALSIATLDPDPFAWGAYPTTATFRPFEPAALRPDGSTAS
jgi:nucleoside-diphosphate-sugar epimerase